MAPQTAPAQPPLAVLMYHSVSSVREPSLRALAVPPERLREQLTALAVAGYRLTGLSEAVDLRATGSTEKVVALTFDDGYVDFLDAALPVLSDLSASATLYMSTGHAGEPASWLGPHAPAFGPLLTWGQLREVAAAGVEIGSHSLLHHPLDVLPAAQLEREIRDSRDRLADQIQRSVRSFAYPHGYHGANVRAAVARAGHDNACEVGRRLYTSADHPLAIPRLHPTPDHSGADLVRLVADGGPQLLPRIKQAAQPAWRVTRLLAGHLFHVKLT
ncbi:polysaccharide deacetylase family protein [Planosporangium sp. 12N6]|uniref:polysaccharide deacetylase family protein n=1 Tax=Planosporangium spinosum TaxID=3402278 RepID=UPI003CE9375F